MSETVLRFIPEDPEYVPDERAQQDAYEFIANHSTLPGHVRSKLFAGVQFVDQGANFERVRCPQCGTTFEDTWWQQAMDTAWASESFGDLSVTVPCCETRSTLHELRYEMPAGFARFVIETNSPDADLANDDACGNPITTALEDSLRCKLRRIWAHY
jgi:hypothetical protein